MFTHVDDMMTRVVQCEPVNNLDDLLNNDIVKRSLFRMYKNILEVGKYV